MIKLKLILLLLTFSSHVWAGWKVDCSNHCFFNDIQPNCQGVFWEYEDGYKGYSSWSNTHNGCLEVNSSKTLTHLITKNQISCNCPTPSATPPTDKSMPLSSQTREKLELLRAQVQGWTMCAPSAAATYADLFNPFRAQQTQNCQQMRKQGIDRTYLSPRGCYQGLNPNYDWTCNFNGDQLASTPAGCLAGYMDLCYQIKDAQDPVTGAFYRNPYMRRHPVVTHFQPSFSRDQLYGALAYWSKTKDKNSLWKWLNFVKNNGTAPWGAGIRLRNLCPPRPNIPKPPHMTQEDWDNQLPDDRCAIIPQTWGSVYGVALWVGITPGELQAWDADIYNSMVGGYLTLDQALYTTSLTVPALGASAYQVANTFDGVNLRLNSGGNNATLRNAATIINERTSKLSPLFHYVAEGKATEYGAYLIRKYCTAAKPNWGDWYKSGYVGYPTNQTMYQVRGENFFSTSYQFAGGQNAYGATVVPNGHDCISFLNLYLGNNNLTELACEDGNQLINGACLRYPFPQPTLAAINGIDYKLDTSNGKINYMAIHQYTCPYGGSLRNDLSPARCEFASGLTAGHFHSGVNYWVDPNPAAPGIYYASTFGKCFHGGRRVGGNCRLHAYTPTVLQPNVSYWVDPNPSWPGVYYKQINGQCPHGGSFSGPNCQIQSLPGGILKSTGAYFTRSNFTQPGVYYYPRVIPEKRKKIIYKESVLKNVTYD